MLFLWYTDSPLGVLGLVEDSGALTELFFGRRPVPMAREEETPLILEAEKQLAQYFQRERRNFDLPLRPRGTVFQLNVWKALTAIPYGETRSYLEVAQMAGCPRGCRAVGRANHSNPISIFIPCHRVIGANGSLTGYGGGLAAKEYLLRLEKGLPGSYPVPDGLAL